MLAADVDSPLLGPAGAAAVFGPQKGATPDDVTALEAALTTWADSVAGALGASPPTMASHRHQPGPGPPVGSGSPCSRCSAPSAARGSTSCSTSSASTTPWPAPTSSSPARARSTTQTLAGKAVAGVARRADAHGIPVVAVCGRLYLDAAALATLGVRSAYPLSDLEPQDPGRSGRTLESCCAAPVARIAPGLAQPATG